MCSERCLHQMATNDKFDVSRKTDKNDLGSYREFLETFLQKGYEFVLFPETCSPYNTIIMRHDVDFDCQYALAIAQIEREANIRSTFFFMASNDSYNMLSEGNRDAIKAIKALGHSISLHFDPTVYDDYEVSLKLEIELFETLFGSQIHIVSIHRPTPGFLELDGPINGVRHTYEFEYFRKVRYFSDSQGKWRFGHPFESQDFEENKTMQVLTHPIWWVVNENGIINKLDHYRHEKENFLKQHIANNCIPFQKDREPIE